MNLSDSKKLLSEEEENTTRANKTQDGGHALYKNSSLLPPSLESQLKLLWFMVGTLLILWKRK